MILPCLEEMSMATDELFLSYGEDGFVMGLELDLHRSQGEVSFT